MLIAIEATSSGFLRTRPALIVSEVMTLAPSTLKTASPGVPAAVGARPAGFTARSPVRPWAWRAISFAVSDGAHVRTPLPRMR